MKTLGIHVLSLGIAVCVFGFASDTSAAPKCDESSSYFGKGDSKLPPTQALGSKAPAVKKPDLRTTQLPKIPKNLDWLKADYANALKRKYPDAIRIELLGEGGEGLVYRVDLPGESRVFKFPRDPYKDRVLVAMAREPELYKQAAKADPEGAKHIVPVKGLQEFFIHGVSVAALELKYANQGTLQDHLEQLGTHVDSEKMLNLWKEMALGVRALHRSGAVHRDIKPANVLWHVKTLPKQGPKQVTWISDLGIAEFFLQEGEGGSYSLADGNQNAVAALGTLTHMSDEQMRGLPPEPKNDLYSLKVVFAETLMGAPIHTWDPRNPENGVLLLDIHFFGRVHRLSGVPAKLEKQADPELVKILRAEFETSDQLVDAIDAALVRVKESREQTRRRAQ